MDVPPNFLINDYRKPEEFRKKLLVDMQKKMFLMFFSKVWMKINLKKHVSGVVKSLYQDILRNYGKD